MIVYRSSFISPRHSEGIFDARGNPFPCGSKSRAMLCIAKMRIATVALSWIWYDCHWQSCKFRIRCAEHHPRNDVDLCNCFYKRSFRLLQVKTNRPLPAGNGRSYLLVIIQQRSGNNTRADHREADLHRHRGRFPQTGRQPSGHAFPLHPHRSRW